MVYVYQANYLALNLRLKDEIKSEKVALNNK